MSLKHSNELIDTKQVIPSSIVVSSISKETLKQVINEFPYGLMDNNETVILLDMEEKPRNIIRLYPIIPLVCADCMDRICKLNQALTVHALTQYDETR